MCFSPLVGDFLWSLLKAGGWEDYFYRYWPIYAPTIGKHHHLHNDLDHHSFHHLHNDLDHQNFHHLRNDLDHHNYHQGGMAGIVKSNITHYTMQYRTIPCNTSQNNTVQYHKIHAIPSNDFQYQYHAICTMTRRHLCFQNTILYSSTTDW